MDLNDVETLQDLGVYFSEQLRRIDIYDPNFARESDRLLSNLVRQFSLSEDEKQYICSRVFSQESQSNEATLKLAQMANKIKIKNRKNK